jgi:hypothetical protein
MDEYRMDEIINGLEWNLQKKDPNKKITIRRLRPSFWYRREKYAEILRPLRFDPKARRHYAKYRPELYDWKRSTPDTTGDETARRVTRRQNRVVNFIELSTRVVLRRTRRAILASYLYRRRFEPRGRLPRPMPKYIRVRHNPDGSIRMMRLPSTREMWNQETGALTITDTTAATKGTS